MDKGSFNIFRRWKYLIGLTLNLYFLLAPKRKAQVLLLIFTQFINGFTEFLSMSAIIPFLTAITNADSIIKSSFLKSLLFQFNVTTEKDLIIAMTVLFIFSFLIATLMRIATIWMQESVTSDISQDIGTLVFSKILNLPFSFHTQSNSSTLLSSLTNDLDNAVSTINVLFILINGFFVSFAVLLMLFQYDFYLAIEMLLGFSGLYFVIFFINLKKINVNGHLISFSYKSKIKSIQESIGSIRDIIVDGTQKEFIREFSHFDSLFRNEKAKLNILRQTPKYLVEVFAIIFFCTIIIIKILHGEEILSIITFFGIIAFAANRLIPTFQQAYLAISGLEGSEASMNVIFEVLRLRCESQIKRKNTSFPKLISNKHIEFKNISFGYHGVDYKSKKWVLKNASVMFPLFKTIALIGKSGSGKSTTCDLILGLLRPQEGEIIINGNILNDTNIPLWRTIVSHVPQTIYISDKSILENIAFGVEKNKIDINLVIKCAKISQIHDLVSSFPNQYNEIVGERGVRLSGGQRQRIGIARALYKDAKVIILDESTNALDEETQKDFFKAFDSLVKNKITLIMIAHRKESYKHADYVYEISNKTFRNVTKKFKK